MDLNLEGIEIIKKCLVLKNTFEFTKEYFQEVPEFIDFRSLANGKKMFLHLNFTTKFLETNTVLYQILAY